MDGVDRIAAVLSSRDGVRSLENLGVAGEDLSGLDFACVKNHWGSAALVALVRADGLTAATMQERVGSFDSLTKALHRYAGVVSFITPGGTAAVKLGAFGVIVFVFERGVSRDIATQIKGMRRGSGARMESTLAWSVDAPARKVRTHGLLPRGLFPPKSLIASALH